MGKLIIHTEPDPERLERERTLKFLRLSTGDKLKQLFALIDLTVRMNGGRPSKNRRERELSSGNPKNQRGTTLIALRNNLQ